MVWAIAEAHYSTATGSGPSQREKSAAIIPVTVVSEAGVSHPCVMSARAVRGGVGGVDVVDVNIVDAAARGPGRALLAPAGSYAVRPSAFGRTIIAAAHPLAAGTGTAFSALCRRPAPFPGRFPSVAGNVSLVEHSSCSGAVGDAQSAAVAGNTILCIRSRSFSGAVKPLAAQNSSPCICAASGPVRSIADISMRSYGFTLNGSNARIPRRTRCWLLCRLPAAERCHLRFLRRHAWVFL